MTHSHVSLEAAETDGLTDGHRFWFGVPVATRPTWRQATLAAGYLISTASDLGRYLSMYLAGGLAPDGSRVVSAAAISTMLTAGPAAHLGPWAEGADARYAMGWFRGGPWTEDALFHPGNTPDSSAMLAYFPERGIAVAVVTNAGHELPAPGNPSITDRVARNVVHAALGQPVPDLPSLGAFYLLFDLIVLVLIAAAGWGTLRAGRALRRHPAEGSARRRGMRWLGVAVRAAAAGGLLVLPLQSYGWRGLWTWAPDLAVVLATLVALLAVTATLRAVALVRGPHAPPPMNPTTERSVGHAHA
jgi:CubicO group peptidase (beta-lactamase class C family)